MSKQFIEATPAIDLRRHHFKRVLGDITLWGTWLYNDDKEDTEPAMVMTSSHNIKAWPPVVIALSAVHKYVEPKYLAQVSAKIAERAGSHSMAAANRIANMIYDNLDDLLTMPPDPKTATVVGQAHLGDGRTLDLLDHEQRPTH